MQKRNSLALVVLASLVILLVLVSYIENNGKKVGSISDVSTEELGPATPPKLQTPVITPAPILMPGSSSGWAVYSSLVHREPFETQIFLKDLNTGTVKQLTTLRNNDQPRWSPNGMQIMFLSWSKKNSDDIYVMNRDGSNQHPLVASSASEDMADWSPDGNSLAYVSNSDGTYQIYTYNIKTQSTIQLTHRLEEAFSPNWSADGKYIAFSSSTKGDGRSQIFIMNADGTHQRQVTEYNLSNFDESPVWCPDSSCIIFKRDNGVQQLMTLDLASSELSPLLISVFDSMRQETALERTLLSGYITFSVDQKFYTMDMNSRKIYYLPIVSAIDLSFFP